VSGWAERWQRLLPGGGAVDAAEPAAALTRRAVAQGHAWARAGRVADLRTRPGLLTGRVHGGRATPYLVEVGLPVMADEDWTATAEVIASRARHEAQLLAGHVPDGLEADLEAVGVVLFPAPGDIAVGCPCGREAEPCAHAAALWAVAGERFEQDPFAWLRLRGRGRERLLADIASARRRGTPRPAGLAVTDLPAAAWTRAREPLEDLAVALPAPPERPAGPLRLLGDPPGWAGGVSAGDLFAPLVARGAAHVLDVVTRAGDPADGAPGSGPPPGIP
jgi:uncharacterized Zn finger protein